MAQLMSARLTKARYIIYMYMYVIRSDSTAIVICVETSFFWFWPWPRYYSLGKPVWINISVFAARCYA